MRPQLHTIPNTVNRDDGAYYIEYLPAPSMCIMGAKFDGLPGRRFDPVKRLSLTKVGIPGAYVRLDLTWDDVLDTLKERGHQ